MTVNINTLCVHGNAERYDRTGAISVPIYQTATYAHLGVGKSTGFDYSRLHNPTREHLEKTITKLEGGLETIAFSTGMGAITCVMTMFSPGDHIIASEDIYGGSHRLFHQVCMKNGITFDFLDTSEIENVKSKIRKETKAIFVETPTNPMMHVTDIAEVSKIAKENKLLLIIDNTFLTPYFQNPIALGADIVVHSGTKFLGGHNDALGGFVVATDPVVLEKLKVIAKTLGACLSPFDSWLIIRGIKTLPIRMKQQAKSAMVLARWLEKHEKVHKVFYIGLESHKSHDVCKKQARGFGAMISFEVDHEETAKQILENVKIIQFAESLGGVETLITYPMMQTHVDVPKEERERKGINEKLLRISVGLEDIEDLMTDLENALK